MSGSSRGKPTPLVPLIGFTRVEEGLDSFGTKDYSTHPTQSVYCSTFTVPSLPCWSRTKTGAKSWLPCYDRLGGGEHSFNNTYCMQSSIVLTAKMNIREVGIHICKNTNR